LYYPSKIDRMLINEYRSSQGRSRASSLHNRFTDFTRKGFRASPHLQSCVLARVSSRNRILQFMSHQLSRCRCMSSEERLGSAAVCPNTRSLHSNTPTSFIYSLLRSQSLNENFLPSKPCSQARMRKQRTSQADRIPCKNLLCRSFENTAT
jgi:hypothetical protein